MLRSSALLALLILSVSPVSGCRGCKKDRPYVPYTIDGTALPPSAPPSAPPPPSASSAFDGGAFPRAVAQQAPPGTSTWSLGGLSIAAPPGRVFLQGLVMTSPGKPTAIAAYVGDGGSLAGEVVLYRADASGGIVGPTTLARLPDWMPTAQGCQHLTTLAQIGPQTLWLDVIASCAKPEAKRLHRYLAAISLAAEGAAVRVDFRGAELPPSERVVIDADASDRDGDGVDDLAVQVSIEGAIAPLVGSGRATAALRFLGPATRMSRDTQEPGKSLRQQASWVAQLAGKRGTAEEAMSGGRQVRRLFQLLCAEGGGPGLVLGDGSPLACGDTATVEDARYAEARAALAAGDVASAFAQATRLRGARPKSKRAADLDLAIENEAKPKKAHARPLKVIPIASSIALPLAFDASGALLVQGEEGPVRVDPASGTETAAPDIPKWSPLALLVGDMRIQAEGDSCRTEPIRLLIQGSESGARGLPLGILGSTAPLCPAPFPLVLLDRNADGLTTLLEGIPVLVTAAGDSAAVTPWPGTPGPQGSSRSPDGKWTALATNDRVLLRGPDRSETWRPQPFFTLAGCVAANEGKAVACVLEHGAVLLTP